MKTTNSQLPMMAQRSDARSAGDMREASWSAVAIDTAFERPTIFEGTTCPREPKSGVALRFPHALQDASRLCMTLGLAVLLAGCGKKQEAPKAAEAPKPAAVSDTKIEAEVSAALTPAPAASSADQALKAEAEDILGRYPGKNAVELLATPEVKDKLAVTMKKLAADPVLMKRVNSSVDLAAQIKGLEGAAKLDLDMKDYDRARTSRMLQSVLSEEPQRIVDFLVGEIGEAAPDLSYGGLERAPNGVAIVPNTIPAPAPAPAPPPEE